MSLGFKVKVNMVVDNLVFSLFFITMTDYLK